MGTRSFMYSFIEMSPLYLDYLQYNSFSGDKQGFVWRRMWLHFLGLYDKLALFHI